MGVFGNFIGNRFTISVFIDPSRQVPVGFANETTGSFFTLKFVYNIGGETYRLLVFVEGNIN